MTTSNIYFSDGEHDSESTKPLQQWTSYGWAFRQLPEWRSIINLIAGNWNEPDQDVGTRIVKISQLLDVWGKTSHHIIEIGGTPPQGMVIVPVSKLEPVVGLSRNLSEFGEADVRRLRDFVAELLRIVTTGGDQ